MIDKKVANRVLTNLDFAAARIDELAKSGKIDPKVASELVRGIDTYADRFQVAAFGEDSLKAYQAKVAKVFEKDSDEKYMDTFDKPQAVLEGDSDEPYMKTFDQDQTQSVTDRDEHQVRDLSEHAESTKKQPSWARGPAGKSTRQGSTAPKAAPKSWAE